MGNKSLYVLLTCLIIQGQSLWAQLPEPRAKARILVLTDIENEPDDAQSLVRLLTYANELDIEGLVATTSIWQQEKIADWRINEIISAYGKVQPNLMKHALGYPSQQYLEGKVKKGLPKFGMAGVGKGQGSEGSDWIIEVVDQADDRPVWITVWGGANCLAQALWKVRQTRSPQDLRAFISKIRVYTISDQDNSGPWIRKNFPNLFYVVSPGYHENGGDAYFYATWSGISGEPHYGFPSGADTSIVQNPWLTEHIRTNHGPLGEEYPLVAYAMEGDTPSFLSLINNGLNNPQHPDWGGWGGRYELYTPREQAWFYEAETSPIWTDAIDRVRGNDGLIYADNKATIWRWRKAYQHDFAARMDWSNTSQFGQANHPPQPALAHEEMLTVHSGQQITLDASSTTDPENDAMKFEWFWYPEAGTYRGNFVLKETSQQQITFEVPKVALPKTMHLILTVEDEGTPSLTRYKRVILNILPPEE